MEFEALARGAVKCQKVRSEDGSICLVKISDKNCLEIEIKVFEFMHLASFYFMWDRYASALPAFQSRL